MFGSIKSRLVAAAAAALFASGGVASAASLINVQILGSYNGSPYSSDLSGVAAGGPVSFEIVGQLAGVGTQNSHVVGGITSVSSADGIGSLSYNLADNNGGVLSGLTLSNAFTLGSGQNPGTISADGSSASGVRPIGANGVFAGATTSVILETGTLTAGSLTSNETLSAIYGSLTSGAKINSGAKSLVINTTTEASTDPYVGFTPLTIEGTAVVSSSTPAAIPASAAMLSLAGLWAMRRRSSMLA